MSIILIFKNKFPVYQPRKYYLNRFDFIDITNLIQHSYTDIISTNLTLIFTEDIFRVINPFIKHCFLEFKTGLRKKIENLNFVD